MVHQADLHDLGSQVVQILQEHQGNHLQIQDRELRHQELVQSSQRADHVQQDEQHQVLRPALQQSKVQSLLQVARQDPQAVAHRLRER